MTKSNGQNTRTPYEIIKQPNGDLEPLNPSVNNPLAPEDVVDAINSQSQPEQQPQAHEGTEGQRRALQLIEEYADDINLDDYELDDDINTLSEREFIENRNIF